MSTLAQPTAANPNGYGQPFTDPVAEAAAPTLPDAMVAAAFSHPTGAVRVLAGTALRDWIANLVRDAITAEIASAHGAWIAETVDLVDQSTVAALRSQAAHWDRTISGILQASPAPDPAHDAGATVRRTTVLPRLLATSLKSTAASRGLTQQEAIAEAVRCWVTSNATTGRGR